ncbi:hypothetical protein RF11_01845 [Thelohanellus kitauei]|uniref:Uncharacterized protein n=1 Tax=Thelohanellus kitauei TaxID=669202 RepID=A0A0C2ICP4_THEKT|nr:hypothetical protein RF11_01845 [Thelohanellus kitauei]
MLINQFKSLKSYIVHHWAKNTDDNHFGTKYLRYANYIRLIIIFCTSITPNDLVTGAFSVSISTIDRFFKLSYLYVSRIMTYFNLSLALVSVPVSYLSKNHKQTYINLECF